MGHKARRVGAPALVALGAVGVAGVLVTGVAGATAGPGPPALTRTMVYSIGVAGGEGKMLQLDHPVPTQVPGIPGHVVEVATSNSDSYALTSSGAVWAWGAGGLGELGNGSTPRLSGTPVRVELPPGVKISSLPNPMPYNSGLAIDTRGDLWGWGFNQQGSLCMPGGPLLRPVRLPATGVTLASGAGDHTLFDSRGTVYACGLGQAGELGDGSTASSSDPVAVVGLPLGVVSLTSSWQGSGALLSNGAYYDWGFNREGQMGNGGTTDVLAPVKVNLPHRVVQVWQGGSTASNGQTLALLTDGSVWAWGAGQLGQLGDGGWQSASAPVRVSLPAHARISEVCSGGDTSYALTTSGELWSWGGNLYGQLGQGRGGLPQALPGQVDVTLAQLSATATNVVGLATPVGSPPPGPTHRPL